MRDTDVHGNREVPLRAPVTSAEFDLVCDMIEILLAFMPDPRTLTGTPAEARIFAFKAMRDDRRRG